MRQSKLRNPSPTPSLSPVFSRTNSRVSLFQAVPIPPETLDLSGTILRFGESRRGSDCGSTAVAPVSSPNRPTCYKAGMRYLVVALSLLAISCGSNTPTAPTPPPPPPVPACQANNTASVTFRNDSRSTTQDIYWDGLKYFTLAPGQTSTPPLVVAAGVAHRLEPRITNTNNLACQASSPIPAICSTPLYFCAFP